MKKTIQIKGVGSRKHGIGKRGPYDFTEYGICYEDKYFEGEKCETVGIDADTVGNRVIAVGDVLEVEMFQINFKTRIACIYG